MQRTKKKFKDYGLIRFYGKENKSFESLKPHNEEVMVLTTFGDALVPVEFAFEKKVAVYVRYEVKGIYDKYLNKEKFPTCEDFERAFCKENSFFQIETDITSGHYIGCDLKRFNNEKTVSQGFFNLAIFIGQMSEFLGGFAKDEIITERDIRDYNLHYLTKSTNFCKYFAIGSVVASLISFILAIVLANANSNWLFLFVLLFLAGLGVAGFFFIKFKYFDYLRRNAKR